MSYTYNPLANDLDYYENIEESGGLLAANNLDDVADQVTAFNNVANGAFEIDAGDEINTEANLNAPFPVTLAQLIWLRANNAAGTDYINMLQVNADDEINVGAAMNVGPLEAAADSGAVVLFDMPVTATPVAGTEMSTSIRIDGDTFIKVYAEADSAGGIQNPRVTVPSGVGVRISGLTAYANNAAAISGGLAAGDLYRTSADPSSICIVY